MKFTLKRITWLFLLLSIIWTENSSVSAQIIPYTAASELNTPSVVNTTLNGIPDMASNNDQNWMVTWGTPSSIEIAISNDAGKSWSPSKKLFTTASLLVPSIATNKKDTWIIAWRDKNIIFYAVSNDLGISWSTPFMLNGSSNRQPLTNPVITANNEDDWKIVWAEKIENKFTILESNSNDLGQTWTNASIIKQYEEAEQITNISDIEIATNVNSDWGIIWVLNKIGDSNKPFISQLVASKSSGTSWDEPTLIQESEIIRNPKMTNDDNENWITIWSEEDNNESSFLRDKIYTALSTSNLGSWNPASFIRQGKYPCIQHLSGERWGLVTSSRNFINNSGTDIDIVISHSNDNGLNWGNHHLVNSYGFNDAGNWTDGAWFNDYYPVFDKNTTGGWVVAWMKSYVQNGQPVSDINFALADSSPPFPISVKSDQGNNTSQSTALSFSWKAFIDEESGVDFYEYAFGDSTDIEKFQAFSPIQRVDSIKTLFPTDFPNDFNFFFPTNKYIFTIRAINKVGLYRDTFATVCVTPLKIGEPIPLPDGKDWEDINWSATSATFNPSKNIVFNEAERLLLANDYNREAASFSITWVFMEGPDKRIDYNVAPTPYKIPMILYHTHQANSEITTLAPGVDITSIDQVTIHYNTTVPDKTNPDDAMELPTFWQERSPAQRDFLYARGTTTQTPAFVILTYEDDNDGYLGYEIVELKEDKADVPTGIVDIGSRILPYDTLAEREEVEFTETFIRKPLNGDENLMYQHKVVGAAQEGHIWAIRKSTEETDIEIIWKRKGLEDIIWPFQLREYAAPNWPSSPDKYQLYVRGEKTDTLGPEIHIPKNLNVKLMDFQEPAGHALVASSDIDLFSTDESGWSLLKYQTGPTDNPGLDWIGFEVVRSVSHKDESLFNLNPNAWTIGLEIEDAYHEGPRPGYIHIPIGDKFAPPIYSETGQVFGVNLGLLEVWWYNLSRLTDPEGNQYPSWPEERVQWPSKVAVYDTKWGDIAEKDKIVIARQNGSEVIRPEIYGTDWSLYFQNEETSYGFNPNDEHAKVFPYESGRAIFALRDDLGSTTTSEPYVLMQYKEQPNNDKWRFRVFQVLREQAPYLLKDWEGIARPIDRYEGDAGKLIQAPFPLSLLQYCEETEAISGPFFEDRTERHWAKAAGNENDSATAEITMQYFYPIQEGFYLGQFADSIGIGSHVPWLDNLSGTSADVTYTIHWPDDVPTMKIGQTIIEKQLGIPSIDGPCTVDVIYEQSIENGAGRSVLLVDPIQTRAIDLDGIPDDIKTEQTGTEKIFVDLSLALRRRISFDQTNQKLKFKGERISPVIGFDYSLLNVMSERDRDELLALSQDINWKNAVENLYQLTKDPVIIRDSSTDPFDLLALTSGLAEGVGYVTLVMQNGTQCDPLPISLEIIKVIPELEPNDLIVITPNCPFDETLTLRHKGDFGGDTDNYQFEWKYIPDENGTVRDSSYEDWLTFSPTPSDGQGAVDITIKGPGLLTLSDNHFVARYKTPSGPFPWSDKWSDWTKPQLAEGWIKRVVGDINPFTQRASGGGIEGAENNFFDFGSKEVNTIVSMLRQAGERWTGNVPLNCNNINDFGLIEIYETVLGRGVDLSIEGIPPVDYPPANSALLLVASRIADMYTLLGNEAFADASDPTIAFGTEDGTYGAEAASIHCFQNQTASLLEEELNLLRGRDDTNSPGVDGHPVYNRLFWNFTNGDGEVAYASNYDIQDQSGLVDGTIDEADAKKFYPQGHGDAWGHYLTAIKTLYKLLRHPNYTWNARSEGILLGGQPITVDYLDERKFAVAAAAKARTGAEITSLTYRAAYVENPEGQWQGYKDTKKERAWGFDEWAVRSSQGAYFDWIVGNAILPPLDSINTGIQKIDRTTVLELREVASRALEIQAKVDEANVGLNPLGLATNVIPFDISPTAIDQNKTHFEQIYDRAVTAMNNAITVFNHANNSTQLLRRQADNLNDFNQAVEDREIDFTNRLIEIFGYPYIDDIGPGRTYETGYNGPDIYHFNYVDASDLMLTDLPTTVEVPVYFRDIEIDGNGGIREVDKEVIYHLSNSAEQFGEIKPDSWNGSRRAPGEIQMARSELIQTKSRFDRALIEYENLITQIETQAALLQAQYNLNADEISVLNAQFNQTQGLNNLIARSRERQLNFRTNGRMATIIANAIAEFLPTAIGFSTDATAPARGAIRLAGTVISESMMQAADSESLAELDHQQTLQLLQAQTNIVLTTNRQEQGILNQISQLQQIARQEASLRLELYSLLEAIQQASGRYMSVLAKGQRLLEDRNRFRRQTAANIQSRRYKDMAFRIFRNDALQKYRAQFDLAARYVYLAAKAYDYETTMLSDDSRSGEAFLTSIVRQRLIGTIQGGIPQTGQGLADPMQRMSQNFQVFKSQLGFDNPQKETNRFSLRKELLRIRPGFQGNAEWRNRLRSYVVPNIFDVPEFQRYCRPFAAPQISEPAIVIPIETNVTFGMNFFGKDLEGGDSAYDPSNFTTKIRSVGVWFSNYNDITGSGMSNTPRVYLIPVGSDIQRSPTGQFGDIREFKVLDQIIPAPFSGIGGELNNPNWIPSVDNLTSSFAEVRRFPSFRAYHDSGNFSENEVHRDSRLIGRSVWNTRWLLIIPAGTLHSNREEGINRFIDGQLLGGGDRNGNGISDIRLFFETYAFPGF